MDKVIKRSLRIFWLWQEDKEMEWLRQMSLIGWHLINVCIFIYTFEKGEPMDILYYGDFKSIKKRDVDEYLQIFKDAGWKYICRQGNWFYFSSPADNKYKEVYSDNQSRLSKYRTLLAIHAIILPMLSNLLIIVSNRVADNETFLLDALLFVVFLLLLVAIYSIIKLIVLVTKLRKSASE